MFLVVQLDGGDFTESCRSIFFACHHVIVCRPKTGVVVRFLTGILKQAQCIRNQRIRNSPIYGQTTRQSSRPVSRHQISCTIHVIYNDFTRWLCPKERATRAMRDIITISRSRSSHFSLMPSQCGATQLFTFISNLIKSSSCLNRRNDVTVAIRRLFVWYITNIRLHIFHQTLCSNARQEFT